MKKYISLKKFRHSLRLFFIAFIFHIPFGVLAESKQPTLEETIDWLILKIDGLNTIVGDKAGNTTVVMNHSYKLEKSTENTCLLYMQNRAEILGPMIATRTDYLHAINLSGLSLDGLKVKSPEDGNFYNLEISRREKNAILTTERSYDPEKKAFKDPELRHENNFSIIFSDQDLAERAKKALRRAIELCGGGTEPF